MINNLIKSVSRSGKEITIKNEDGNKFMLTFQNTNEALYFFTIVCEKCLVNIKFIEEKSNEEQH